MAGTASTFESGPSSVFGTPRLAKHDFDHLATLIENHAGIRMPPSKRTMVEGRLLRRLRERNIPSYSAYCRFLFEDGGLSEELSHLIDAITTNKTEFFREPKHFTYLAEEAVPELLRHGIGSRRPLHVWSAGCSIGAEAYTLAMVLSDLKARRTDLTFSILGTDICTAVLKTAAKAIYPAEMAEPIPADLRRHYLLRSRDRAARLIRMGPEVRATAGFHHLNFMDADYRLPVPQDIVFCRNVIIYFDTTVRTLVLNRICACIPAGGYLFMGHSETITGISLPLRPVAPTVYRKV